MDEENTPLKAAMLEEINALHRQVSDLRRENDDLAQLVKDFDVWAHDNAPFSYASGHQGQQIRRRVEALGLGMDREQRDHRLRSGRGHLR